MPSYRDRRGEKHHMLTVIRHEGSVVTGGQKKTVWRCKCDCGNETVVHAGSLGKTKSCGCYTNYHRSHGESGSRGYGQYSSAKSRCENVNNEKYHVYGARGIKFKFKNYSEFLSVMGNAPVGMTLDRIDTDGDYEPSNCRWATQKEQQNNRNNNLRIEYKGQTKTLAEWCGGSGTNFYKKVHRLLRKGVSFEEAFYRYAV